jgi:4-alpha-glucanotransferase
MDKTMNDSSFLTAPHWARIGVRHHHGICLPLSSLVSSQSCGIGEYLDLLPLLQWLPQTGFDLLQLLPLNDTDADPSPYMALSGHALHPLYLSLRALPEADAVPGLQKIINRLTKLNQTPFVQYHDVLALKEHALELYLDHRIGAIEEDPLYQAFVERHRSWLTTYSIFRTLKHIHDGRAWWDWQPSARTIDPSSCHVDAALVNRIFRWRAIQYLCFSQWHQVQQTARRNGIRLIGDVPILLNKDSADVWRHPTLFSMDYDVGAPPDMYNAKGQHWGFPLFRWAEHRKTDFVWWKERLSVQEMLYDLYRLDHLVGFFRLYAIPEGKDATKGHFVPKHPAQWKKLGEEILTTLIRTTTMLPLGEDLGDVPPLVRQSMQELGVPGMKVLRWERHWSTNRSFISPSSFSPESLTTVSTHDSSTLREWWAEDREASQEAADDYGLEWEPTCTPPLLFDLLLLSHRSGSLIHCNLLNEYLAIFPELSWADPARERINIPGTIRPTNWTYRIHVPLETIIQHSGLQHVLSVLSRQ